MAKNIYFVLWVVMDMHLFFLFNFFGISTMINN